jgi:hypothetical protein
MDYNRSLSPVLSDTLVSWMRHHVLKHASRIDDLDERYAVSCLGLSRSFIYLQGSFRGWLDAAAALA